MRSSYALSRSRAGDFDVIAGPTSAIGNPATVRGVVICHALGHTAATYLSPNNGRPQAWALLQTIAARYPTIVADLAGDNGGNDAGIAAVGSAISYLQGASSPARAKAGTVLLVGVSMGFITACAYARANLASVAAIAGILPANDLSDIYTNNRGGAAAILDTAYGGTYVQATQGPTHDPTVFGASLTKPIKLWYGTADTTVPAVTVTNFASIAPSCTVAALAGVGHDTEAAYPLALTNGLMAFLAANE